MSGDYVLVCGCGDTIQLERTCGTTIVALVSVLPELEVVAKANIELEDVRGDVYDPAGVAIEWLLLHWRHGTLSYYYTNNNNPPVVLVIPERAKLPTPCGVCSGRRLIPCPEC